MSKRLGDWLDQRGPLFFLVVVLAICAVLWTVMITIVLVLIKTIF